MSASIEMMTPLALQTYDSGTGGFGNSNDGFSACVFFFKARRLGVSISRRILHNRITALAFGGPLPFVSKYLESQ